jgi:hypothetical protein
MCNDYYYDNIDEKKTQRGYTVMFNVAASPFDTTYAFILCVYRDIVGQRMLIICTGYSG